MENIKNKLICAYKKGYYSLYEKCRLRIERLKYQQKIKTIGYSEKPQIFVYIPTFNRSNILIDRSLASVLSQTYKNIYVLVVGDGCTDDTESKIKKIKDPRLNFINLHPRVKRQWPDEPIYHWLMGATIPANYALRNAVGEFTARIDDDDVWVNTHLEESIDYLRSNDFEFISSHQECRKASGCFVEPTYFAGDKYYTQKESSGEKRGPMLGGMSSILYINYLSFFCFNKDSWRKSWCKNNDIDYKLRLYKAGVRMGFLDKTLSYSQPRPGRTETGSKAILEKKDGEPY